MKHFFIFVFLVFALLTFPVHGGQYLTEAQKKLLLEKGRMLGSATEKEHAQNTNPQREITSTVNQQSKSVKSRQTGPKYLGVLNYSARTQTQSLQSFFNNADWGTPSYSNRSVQESRQVATTPISHRPVTQSRLVTTTANSKRSAPQDQRLATTAKRRNSVKPSRQVTTTITTNNNRSVQQSRQVAKTKKKFNWSGFFKGLGQVAEAINSGMNQANSQYKRSNKIGQLNGNPYNPNSTSNPYGAGNPYNPNSINNPYGKYGSPYSNKSATNPYATNPPKLYDSHGNYRGKLSTNPYDPDSVSNPYGRYGNPYSPDSINNPYGAGNPYRPDSPNNPYGTGWMLIGD